MKENDKTSPIYVFTGTRAEYGLLRPLWKYLAKTHPVSVVASGMHLSNQFGNTIDEILLDAPPNLHKIPMLISGDSSECLSKSMGVGLLSFGPLLENCPGRLAIILGDRSEALVFAIACVNANIPIAHIHGGEISLGSRDEFYRHAITKLSTLHFTSNEAHRQRVVQMGEHPNRVFNTGALGVEILARQDFIKLDQIKKSISSDELNAPFALVTIHPEVETEDTKTLVKETLAAISKHSDIFFLFTKANSDPGGAAINQEIESFCCDRQNTLLVDSLGTMLYPSTLRAASMVIGNSSSGIIEAPSVNTPSINIGSRQTGRISAPSVIHCPAECDEISSAISACLGQDMQTRAETCKNPYYQENTCQLISEQIIHFLNHERSIYRKKFYDIER